MRRILLFCCIVITLFPVPANSQSGINNTPEILEKLYDRLAGNQTDYDRLRINDSIRIIIDSYVESDTVFKSRFNNIRHLGQITSPDNSIKMLTWNLVLDSGTNRYFCYFIRKTGRATKNKIYRLSAAYSEKAIRTDTIYSQRNWYGALYYDIRPFQTGGKKSWILLGIDYGNPAVSRKVIDVLNFTEQDSIIFGSKCFIKGEDVRYRDVLQYSSKGTMTLRFGSVRSIIFDHLVPFPGSPKNDPQYYGSDYSFDAYNFKNGLWKFSLNVDVRNKK
jgi:hypothetical protein